MPIIDLQPNLSRISLHFQNVRTGGKCFGRDRQYKATNRIRQNPNPNPKVMVAVVRHKTNRKYSKDHTSFVSMPPPCLMYHMAPTNHVTKMKFIMNESSDISAQMVDTPF
jgi:hypothetical protein